MGLSTFYHLQKNNGKCVFRVNLVSNIGFGTDATRTTNPESEVPIAKDMKLIYL